MGSFSIWHWVIVLVIVLVLFGRGRISEVMGDFGKGIKSFKDGLGDDQAAETAKPTSQITVQTPAPSPALDTRLEQH